MLHAQPALPYDHPPHPARDLVRRFELAFAALFHHLAAALPRLGHLARPAWTRLHNAHRRVLAILARLAEGAFPAPRPPRPARQGGGPAPINLPRRRNWLGTLAGHHVRGTASQLRTLLVAPETQALLAQAPPHAKRALARNLRTLGIALDLPLPAVLEPAGPPPPPRPRPPRPPRPGPEPLLPPLQPYVAQAARLMRKRFREP